MQAPAASSPTRAAGQIVFVGASRVRSVNADGSGLRDLSRPEFDVGADAVAASPDGRTIAFERNDCSAFEDCLMVMNAGGSGRLRVGGPADSLAWAPDGRRLAYAGQADSSDVYVVNADGSGRKKLAVEADGYNGLAWSPDGSQLAYVHAGGGLSVVPAAGGAPRVVPGTSRAESVVGWSPDGASLAFVTRRGDLYVGSLDGNASTLVGRGQYRFDRPAWSPDGKQFLMVRGDPIQIHVVGADGTGDRQLTHSRWGEESDAPSWSPDGKKIVFLRGRFPGHSGDQDIWTMDARGTGAKAITTAFEQGGSGSEHFLPWQAPVWVPGRASGGVPLIAPRTVRIRRSVARSNLPPIDDLATGGDRAAVLAACTVRSWDRHGVATLGPVSGLKRLPCAGPYVALAVSGGRVAWISHFVMGRDSSSALFLASAGRHFSRIADAFDPDILPADRAVLENPVGDSSLLVYNRSYAVGNSRVMHEQLWRIDGAHPVLIRSGPDASAVAAVDSGRIATLQDNGIVTLLTSSGVRIRSFKLGSDVDGVRVDGPRLVVLRGRDIAVLDAASGRLQHRRRVSAGPFDSVRLEDTDAGIAVYVAGLAVHLLRMADGRDVVLRLNDEGSEADAQLEPAGLYYTYNRMWTSKPGQFGFVPMHEIERMFGK